MNVNAMLSRIYRKFSLQRLDIESNTAMPREFWLSSLDVLLWESSSPYRVGHRLWFGILLNLKVHG